MIYEAKAKCGHWVAWRGGSTVEAAECPLKFQTVDQAERAECPSCRFDSASADWRASLEMANGFVAAERKARLTAEHELHATRATPEVFAALRLADEALAAYLDAGSKQARADASALAKSARSALARWS